MVDYFATFGTLSDDVEMVLGAARRTGELSIPFWDALIVEAVLQSGADRLFTKTFSTGRLKRGCVSRTHSCRAMGER
jgi:predicted nucleic acid-binding protein